MMMGMMVACCILVDRYTNQAHTSASLSEVTGCLLEEGCVWRGCMDYTRC